MRVLLAEDEVTIAVTLGDALEEAGFEVVSAVDTKEALAALDAEEIDIVLTDIRMPGPGGMAVLERSAELDPARPVIIMTGFAAMEDAARALSLGAKFYVQKPFRNDSMVALVETYSRLCSLEQENQSLREQLGGGGAFSEIIGSSAAMQAVFERVRTVAPTEATILIQGESGTGKERIALAIHHSSRRAEGPFVAISCAALPESLLEAELFGYEKGAFTDARKERKRALRGGRRRDVLPRRHRRHAARDAGQALARAPRTVVRASRLVRDARSRHPRRRRDQGQPCASMVSRGQLSRGPLLSHQRRTDRAAAARERDGDVPLLVQHFIERFGAGREFNRLALDACAMLERYPWPGNVRELENAVQRAIALAGDSKASSPRDDLLPQRRALARRGRGARGGAAVARGVARTPRSAHLAFAPWRSDRRTPLADRGRCWASRRKVLWEKLKRPSSSKARVEAMTPATVNDERTARGSVHRVARPARW